MNCDRCEDLCPPDPYDVAGYPELHFCCPFCFAESQAKGWVACMEEKAAEEQKKMARDPNACGSFGLGPDPASPLSQQVGGDHYLDMVIQPFEYITRNGLGFGEGSVIKYVSRWRNKNGVEDLRKAKQVLELMIAEEEES